MQPDVVRASPNSVRARLYLTATCSVKISVLLFYRRLASSFNRFFFIAIWIGIAYNIGYYVSFVIALSLACRPTQAYWLAFNLEWAATHKFTCVDEHISLPMSAGLSTFGDFYSTLIPCALILSLNLPRRQNLAVYLLFSLGFLVVAAGLLRTIYVNYLINETYDNTWLLWKFWLWTLVELYTSIAAASAPALKPFFRRYLMDPITSGRRNSYSYSRDGQNPANGGRKELGSNVSSTVPLGNNSDVEKIAMSIHGDETRRYELRTLPNGKVEPVQIIAREEKSVEVRSSSPSSSLAPSEHNDWAVASIASSDDGCPLRTYRAEIEALTPIPGPGRPAPVVEYIGGSRQGSRSLTPNLQSRSPSQQGQQPTSILRLSQSNTELSVADRDQIEPLPRCLSQGSVRAARIKAESMKQSDIAVPAADRVVAHHAAARTSRDQYDSEADLASVDYDTSVDDASSIGETLRLPKQDLATDRASSCGDKSLHLPRQGSIEDDGDDVFRRSRVGLAI
jgi:hypothetical protein